MPKAIKKYVTIDYKVLGGTPVISGTRIPVERISELIKQGHSIENLEEEYPWVDKRKIQYAIAYLMEAGLDEFQKTQKILVAS